MQPYRRNVRRRRWVRVAGPAVRRSTVVGVKIHNGAIELHLAEDGDPAAPPILLLHGITSSTASWDWIVPTLAEQFRVLRLDFRGHGASDRAPGAYDVDGYVSDAVAACEQAGAGPCIVMGHSLGGATTAALAQRHPNLLRAAVMEDPPLGPAGSSDDGALEGNSLLDAFRMMRESVPGLQASGMTPEVLAGVLAAAPATSGGTFGDLLHVDGIEGMARSLLALDASVLDPVIDPAPGAVFTFLDRAAPFAVASLVICADPTKPDAVADPSLAAHFAEISPDTDVMVIDGAGHMIHDELTSRARFEHAVMAFLDRVGASPT